WLQVRQHVPPEVRRGGIAVKQHDGIALSDLHIRHLPAENRSPLLFVRKCRRDHVGLLLLSLWDPDSSLSLLRGRRPDRGSCRPGKDSSGNRGGVRPPTCPNGMPITSATPWGLGEPPTGQLRILAKRCGPGAINAQAAVSPPRRLKSVRSGEFVQSERV